MKSIWTRIRDTDNDGVKLMSFKMHPYYSLRVWYFPIFITTSKRCRGNLSQIIHFICLLLTFAPCMRVLDLVPTILYTYL